SVTSTSGSCATVAAASAVAATLVVLLNRLPAWVARTTEARIAARKMIVEITNAFDRSRTMISRFATIVTARENDTRAWSVAAGWVRVGCCRVLIGRPPRRSRSGDGGRGRS